MEVLSRELDALNPSEFAVDGVGHDRGTGHPQRVPGIVQPLLVESSLGRRADYARDIVERCETLIESLTVHRNSTRNIRKPAAQGRMIERVMLLDAVLDGLAA